MAALGSVTDLDNALLANLPYVHLSPISTDSLVPRTIREMDRHVESHRCSAHAYIDPKSALGAIPCIPFGQGILAESSQTSLAEGDSQLGGAGGLLSGVAQQGELAFSSCDEDADGEPDESYHSEHSFWATNPGDTSTSTVATIDVENPPIPFVGRDGKWGGISSCIPVTRDDTQHEHHEHHNKDANEDSEECHQHVDAQKVIDSTFLYSTPSQNTRQKRSASNASAVGSIRGDTSRSAAKARKEATDESSPKKLVSSKPAADRTGEKRSERSGSTKAGRSRKTPSSNAPQHDTVASSEAGSTSYPTSVSSPASSSGRYKLRKKQSVPKLGFAALLTPSRAQLSDQAAKAPADWLDEVGRDLTQNTMGAPEASPGDEKASVAKEEGAEVVVGLEVEVDELELDRARPGTVRDKGRRTFPPRWEIRSDFPLLYQRYYVSSSVSPEVLEMLLRGLNYTNVDDEFHEFVERAQTVQGNFNKPRSILDLYTPRFVKGVGAQKVGMCPVCYANGKVKFFKTKFSAYNYHLQNFHGISALTGLPFTPPTKFRIKKRPNAKPKERRELVQGHCHSCKKWIDVQGPKETEVKVTEIYWWKHAQACHKKASVPDGVGDYFVENQWFERVQSVLVLLGGLQAELDRLLAGSK
ncbi:related to Meiotic expression upregulated protein 26 [Melanopsichium pennsylvanicum]|uniref:Related to Meiotic expression upregulated protein 26 n=2 Tax=Melanopsichium pennsylvanicum TaxID=63383 RepID=A0AAJ4XQF3_9BASI|nr:related to Meiotic expression upregulated protein 26 [Melanopsichium pennsylvanicum 4]SNX86036.1 related to Meiotic expression upregulated protein 26 [Melanopsichium pennsylvanicum]